MKDSVVIAPFDTGLYVNTCPLANVQEDSDNHISLLRVEQVTLEDCNNLGSRYPQKMKDTTVKLKLQNAR